MSCASSTAREPVAPSKRTPPRAAGTTAEDHEQPSSRPSSRIPADLVSHSRGPPLPCSARSCAVQRRDCGRTTSPTPSGGTKSAAEATQRAARQRRNRGRQSWAPRSRYPQQGTALRTSPLGATGQGFPHRLISPILVVGNVRATPTRPDTSTALTWRFGPPARAPPRRVTPCRLRLKDGWNEYPGGFVMVVTAWRWLTWR